jgi:hypothetical protein
VAKRYKFARFFCGHDAGTPRGPKHIAFLDIASTHSVKRFCAHSDASLGNSLSGRIRFGRHIDHMCRAISTQMR